MNELDSSSIVAYDNSVNHHSLSISARLGRLQFHKSGKFRVLQFADIQEDPKVSQDTVRLIEAALDTVRPDIVVFTGNQIAGYDAAYAATFARRSWDMPSAEASRAAQAGRAESQARQAASAANPEHSLEQSLETGFAESFEEGLEESLEETRHRVRCTLEALLHPLVARGVPWAVTFGNHDAQCGLTNAQQLAIYRSFAGCLNPTPAAAQLSQTASASQCEALPLQQVLAPEAREAGTLALPVLNEQGEVVLGLVLLDSGSYARAGGYGEPSVEALQFLAQAPQLVGVPCMAFQHFAVPEYYQVLREIAAKDARRQDAVEGYRTFARHYYVLDKAKTDAGSYIGEGVSCPDVNSGEFSTLARPWRGKQRSQQSQYFAMAAGHDHRNGFVGHYRGVTLIATPTCGFGSYGPAPQHRAARLFEFDIRHPYQPRTQLLEFGAIVGKPVSKKAYTYALNKQEELDGATVNLLKQPRRGRMVMRRGKRLRRRALKLVRRVAKLLRRISHAA